MPIDAAIPRIARPESAKPLSEMAEYKVKFEVFEGPLDLLLYLIKKEEVDIYEVNLTKLATQFIEYIDVMRLLDLEIAGEFLVMAATLMYIKSRELLPVDQQAASRRGRGGRGSALGIDPATGRIQEIQGRCRQLAGDGIPSGGCFRANRPERSNSRANAPGAQAGSVAFSTWSMRSTTILKRVQPARRSARHFRRQMDRQRKDRAHADARMSDRGCREIFRDCLQEHKPVGGDGDFSGACWN